MAKEKETKPRGRYIIREVWDGDSLKQKERRGGGGVPERDVGWWMPLSLGRKEMGMSSRMATEWTTKARRRDDLVDIAPCTLDLVIPSFFRSACAWPSIEPRVRSAVNQMLPPEADPLIARGCGTLTYCDNQRNPSP